MKTKFVSETENEHGSRLFIILVILLVVSFLCLPLAQQVTGLVSDVKFNENRVKTKMPAFGSNAFLNGDYTNKLEAYYSDNYGLREQLIYLNNKINSFLDASYNPKVVKGKNNWLYYLDEVNDYRHIATLTDDQISQIVQILWKYQSDLKDRGIEFVFVIGPNKSTIYPENMPDSVKVVNGESNCEKLEAALAKNGQVNYVLLNETLIKHKNAAVPPLYFLTDTHWNWAGAYLGANTLLEYLSKKLSREIEMPRIVKWEGPVLNNGDLNMMLGIKNESKWMIPKLEPASPEVKLCDKVFWYRDSFGNFLAPMCNPYFKESVEWYTAEKGVTEKIPADYYKGTKLVVFEIVERNLPVILSCNFKF